MTATVGRSVHVKVPATSANLGPGFDTLGMALSFYDELEGEAVAGNDVFVEVIGEGEGEVPTGAENLVVKSIAYTFERFGQKLPGLRLKAHNQIPHGRGMGSSGAAVVSGIMAAKGLLDGRFHASFADVAGVAPAALRHRIILNFEGEAEGKAQVIVTPLAIAARMASSPECA